MADNNTVVPGMEVPRLKFSKTWESPDDFPTFEPDEVQVRVDMQLLHDETKDYLNNVLVPEIEQVKSGDFVKVAGVASFNGRKGDITPQSGDYTAKMVGAADQSLEAYNQYWWKLTETVKYGYVETRTTAGTVAVSSLHASPARTLSVADAVSVDRATGAVSLVSPGTEVVKLYYNGEVNEIVTSDGGDAKAALLGKYISCLYGSEAAFCVTSSTEFGFGEEEVYIDDENDENYGAIFGEWLCQSAHTVMIPYAVYPTKTAHKYGWDVDAYHDAAIVYNTHPYLLVVLTDLDDGGTEVDTYIRDVVKKVDDLHKQFYQ